jgi:hypothetical protein
MDDIATLVINKNSLEKHSSSPLPQTLKFGGGILGGPSE